MTDSEIVRLVAEKVMQWECVDADSDMKVGQFCMNDKGECVPQYWEGWKRFNPLTSDADACQVLDKMAERFNRCFLESNKLRGTWTCHFLREIGVSFYVEDDSRCRAICLAALRAVGVKVE